MLNKIRILSIASGSSGNSMLIGIGNYHVLIDMGISCKKLKDTLLNNKMSFDDIDLVLITHDHSDHVSGIKQISKFIHCPIYATSDTIRSLKDYEMLPIEYDEIKEILDGLKVSCFYVPHDAVGCCGYNLEYNNRKLSYVTDIGYVDDDVLEYLKGSDVVVLESNHDLKMLKNGSYPLCLKRRISSYNGHLSNKDCAETIFKLVQYGTKNFLLAHISKENNTETIAIEETKKRINNQDVFIDALSQSIQKSFIF